MYEDKTHEDIMEDMMKNFGQQVRTDEGSLAYNACAKISEKLEDVYADMDEINGNMLPDTQDLAHLISYAKERSVEYNYATRPVVRGVFQQEIEPGEQFVCNDHTYTVTERIDGYEYRLTCETEGTEANANFGPLEPIDYIDEYLGGSITELLTPGVDDEDEEVFRSRVLDSFKSKAFGGNKADYRLYIDGLEGVGGCKPRRREKDSPWIVVTIISGEYGVPSQELVDEVQTVIDPEQNHGEGEGMAPICHCVLIQPVEGVQVDVETTIVFDDGYSPGTSQSVIEAAVEGYLGALRRTWESNEDEPIIVRLSQVESRILSVEGVIDISGTRINGTDGNFVAHSKQIPVLGGVVIHV